MAERTEEALKELGFTENEARVYLTMLKIGPNAVSTIAGHSGLYRPYVYDTLKRLVEKGLASYVKKEGMRHYFAENPEKLENLLEQKKQILREILPSLQILSSAVKEQAEVSVFQGRQIVKIVERDMVKTLIEKGGENLVIGVDEKRFMQADELTMRWLFSAMKRHNLKERVLVREGDTFLPGKKGNTRYRFISKEFFNPQSTFIYDDKVAIVLFTEPMHGIMIDSKELAESYRRQFNLVWKHAKKRAMPKKAY